MKKKIFMSVSIFTVVALAAFTSHQTLSPQTTADLMLDENIEALTDGDTPDDQEVVKCYCKKTVFSKAVCSVRGSGGYCGGDPCSNHDGNCR